MAGVIRAHDPCVKQARTVHCALYEKPAETSSHRGTLLRESNLQAHRHPAMSATAARPRSDESFGARLRRERERRQIPLASIAENSKISVSHFEDLERDEVSRWPSGIFRKNFIRAYAKAVGLDVEATTKEFLERFPDPNEPPPVEEPPGQVGPVRAPAPAPTIAVGGAKPGVRITVADPPPTFAPGPIAGSIRSRVTAVAYDAAVVGTIGLIVYAVLGSLWAPLCVAFVGYYAGGILLLGNTPGVCFVAATEQADR